MRCSWSAACHCSTSGGLRLLTLETRLSEAERELANVMNSRVPVQLEVEQPIRQAWERASLDWRRRLVGLLVEKVIVNRSKPGGCATWHGWCSKPEDVEILWLH